MRISDWSSDVCSSDLFGTTSQVVDDPNMTAVQPDEIQALLDGAEPLVPGIRGYRALRAWAGVRPLVRPPSWPAGQPLSRRPKVIDHTERGITGAFTVCGGSLRSEEHTSELQSIMRISYAVFCLKKKKKKTTSTHPPTRAQHKYEKT